MTIFSSLDKLEALMIPEIQKVFLEVMQDIVDRALLNEMIAAIEMNDPERLFRATGFTAAALNPILDAVQKIYQDSAETASSAFPRRINTQSGVAIFRFNMRNPRVEQDLKEKSSTLVSRLTEEARQNVRDVLQRGMIAGENPKVTALNIIGRIDPKTKKRVGGVIGLTNNQTKWVANAGRYLNDLNPKYFTLTLRDKRFDGIVRNAIENKTALTNIEVDKIVTAYKSRALRYRGETIARTETIQSINRGEYLANMQLIDDGLVSSSQMTKEWDDVGDKKVRSTHRVIAEKYGKKKGIAIDEPFISPSGARMMVPGDSSMGADAAEIANCRCRVNFRVNWLAGAD